MERLTRRTFSYYVLSTLAMGTLPALSLLQGCSTGWIDTAIADLPTIERVAQEVVAIISIPDPGLDPAVSVLIKLSADGASAALKELKVLVTDYKVSPNDTLLAKIKAGVLDAQKNFGGIIAQLSSIRSATLVSTISQAGSLGLAVLSSILSLLPPNMLVARTAPAPKNVKLLRPEEIRGSFNTVAIANGYEKNQI